MWHNVIILMFWITTIVVSIRTKLLKKIKNIILFFFVRTERLLKKHALDLNFGKKLNEFLVSKEDLWILVDKNLSDKWKDFTKNNLNYQNISSDVYYLKFKLFKYKFIIFISNKNKIYSTKFNLHKNLSKMDIAEFGVQDINLCNFGCNDIALIHMYIKVKSRFNIKKIISFIISEIINRLFNEDNFEKNKRLINVIKWQGHKSRFNIFPI